MQEGKSKAISSLYVSARDEAEGTLYFTLTGLDYSISNGLRRTITANLPTLVFKTFPDKDNQVSITTNTSRFNNEILKQRLSCIPIHGLSHDQPYDELEVIIDKKNNTHDMMFVTTEDFKIKNTKSGKFLTDNVVRKIFPHDEITHDFILLARLRPKISNEVPGESLQITAKISLHTAEEDGGFNVVSCCTYRNTPDKIKQDQMWQDRVKTLGEDESKEISKLDWYNHEAGRIFKPNSFDFKIQTLGVFTNSDIVKNACNIITSRFTDLLPKFNFDNIAEIIEDESKSTIVNSFDIRLEGYGYTIGKVIEHIIHDTYYKNKKILSYIGFRKNHPHDEYSLIRIAFKDKSEDGYNAIISEIMQDACRQAIEIYIGIAKEF